MSGRLDVAALAVSLAPVAPPCFSSRDQWLEYVASSAVAHRKDHLPGPLLLVAGLPAAFNPEFAFCADCNAQHSDAMWRAGKCKPRHLHEVLSAPAAADPQPSKEHA